MIFEYFKVGERINDKKNYEIPLMNAITYSSFHDDFAFFRYFFKQSVKN